MLEASINNTYLRCLASREYCPDVGLLLWGYTASSGLNQIPSCGVVVCADRFNVRCHHTNLDDK
jgi:hypothetical protein